MDRYRVWLAVSRLALGGGHLAKASFDQPGQSLDRRVGVGAAGPQSECRTVSGPQRQQVQDAFTVDHLVSLDNFDLARNEPASLTNRCAGRA